MVVRKCGIPSRKIRHLESKYDSTGGDDNDSFTDANAISWADSHTNSFLVLNRGRRGRNNRVILSVLCDNWLTKPKKECKSVQLLGLGNFWIVAVMAGSRR